MRSETIKSPSGSMARWRPSVRTLSFWLVLLPLLALLTVLLPAGAPAQASPAGVTELVSVDSQGGQADAGSGPPVISGDGRYVDFESSATNLVPGDTNEVLDVFRRDVVKGETLRVSENSVGGGSNDFSRSPDISDDGQAIAFEFSVSLAAISHQDILGLATTGFLIKGFLDIEDLGLFEGGNTCPKLGKTPSPGGRRVVYYADAESGAQGAGIYVEELDTGKVFYNSSTPDDSCQLSFSADGLRVTYASTGFLKEWDLITNEDTALFRNSGGLRSSAGVAGVEPDGASSEPAISGDGRYVAFRSFATNLVPGDTNGFSDIFVHDRQTGETTRVSVSSAGVESNEESFAADISGDGRYVTFFSFASNLVPGDTNGVSDVFVHDRQTGETTRVSVSSDGGEADAGSFDPAISANGLVVAFRSFATNLVPGDTNGVDDIFIHGLLPEGFEATWGDHNCSGSAGPVDSLLTLRFDAGLGTNTGDCPDFGQVVEVEFASPHPWGDVDCGGEVTPVDSLKLLRFDAGLSVSQADGCPGIGTSVTIFDG